MRKFSFLVAFGVLSMFLAIGSNAFAKKNRWKMVTVWPESINLWYGEKEMINMSRQ